MKRLLTALIVVTASAAHAQDYPSRPIRVLIPFAPGGAVDTTARILGANMTQRLGWQFVIENRPGANGFIAVSAAAKAQPDGYTLLMASAGEFTLNPAIFSDVPYDLDRDFAPVTMVTDAPMLFLAAPQAPFSTFRELIAAAKAKAGGVSWSSAGNGSMNHLAGEWLALAAGVKLLHVPYKGGAPAAAAIAASDVAFGVVSIPGATPLLKSGKAKVLGVTTAKRSALDSSWPTPQEAGIPDVDVSIWVGLFAPKGVPQAVVDRLNSEVRRTLDSPDVQKRFAETGSETVGMSQANFLARVRRDAERYRSIVDTAAMKVR